MNQSFRNNKKERETGLEPAASTYRERVERIHCCNMWIVTLYHLYLLIHFIILHTKYSKKEYGYKRNH